MNKRELRKQLEKLHNEIGNAQGMDERGKALLSQAETNIRARFEQNNKKPPIHETTTQLQETIAHLEATHPNITMLLTEFLNILSNAGI